MNDGLCLAFIAHNKGFFCKIVDSKMHHTAFFAGDMARQDKKEIILTMKEIILILKRMKLSMGGRQK